MKAFVLLATIFGLLFVFLTPPCYVPDEVAHFWRVVSIAHGTFNPKGGMAPLPKGYQVFVFCVMHQNTTIDRQMLADAWSIDEKPHELVSLRVVPATYTPVNYLPQLLAALIGRVTGARPMIVFYLGRLFALAAFVALVAFAIQVTPLLKWGFCAAGLLPMTLFMAASWSADAMTIALAFLVTALALRGARDVASPLAAFALGLCKPMCFLVAAIGCGAAAPGGENERRRGAGATLPLAALAGFITLLLVARGGPNAPWPQWRCVTRDPLHLVRVIAHDYATGIAMYADQMVGRLGRLDVILPRPVIWLEWLLLVAIVVTASERVPRVQRVFALAASFVVMVTVSIWMYLTWTPTCADEILGIQGRYFLPILPALMVGLSNPWWSARRVGSGIVVPVAVIANIVAVVAVAVHYYRL